MAGTDGTAGRWGMREDWLGVGWKYLVLRGAVAIVFGIVAMVWPQSTATALAFLWGVWALADGLGSLLQAFQPADSRSSRWLLVPMGLLALVAGLVAVTSPAMTAVALTWVLGIWLVVALASALAAAIGYGLFAGAPGDVIAFIDAFAAGAILTLLASELLPSAHGEKNKLVGLTTAAGFAVAAALTLNS